MDPGYQYDTPLLFYDIRNIIQDFVKNPKVYDDYKGTIAQIREERLGKLLEND